MVILLNRSYFNLQIRLGDHDVTRFDETDNQVNFKEQKKGGHSFVL